MHAVAPGPVGGIESVVRLLASGQHRQGHDVRVLATVDAPGAAAPFLDGLRADGVDVVPIVAPGRAYGHEWSVLREACVRWRPHVVHTHGYRADVVAGTAARRARVPTVTTVHGFTGGDLKNRGYELLQRLAFRRFAAVVAVSAPLARSLGAAPLGVRGERLHLVPNAFDATRRVAARDEARRALGVPATDLRIGWVGRATREKGLDVAIRALAAARDSRLTLSVVGDGPERRGAEALARELRVADRVTWHGMVPGAGALVSAFDALLLSSRTEGTPVVVLEAMAAGVPIVATRVGGVPDVVGVDEALLVAPEHPAALGAALDAVAADSAAARTRADAARARVARDFAVAPWLERYDTVYRAARAAARR